MNIEKHTPTLLIIAAIGIICFTAINFIAGTGTYLNTALTTIKFKQKEIDIGQLKQGQPKKVSFEFQNTGTEPLIVQQVETSCGCTGIKWDKRPVKPGDKGEIQVTYDAKYPGHFRKALQVFCNTKERIVSLCIKGKVNSVKKSKHEE